MSTNALIVWEETAKGRRKASLIISYVCMDGYPEVVLPAIKSICVGSSEPLKVLLEVHAQFTDVNLEIWRPNPDTQRWIINEVKDVDWAYCFKDGKLDAIHCKGHYIKLGLLAGL